MTFNLVPSLLVQLEAFARDEARDRHLELGLKPADALTEDERAFCVEHFFHAHRPADDRPVSALRRAAGPTRGSGTGLSARGAGGAVLDRRPARPAGLAQAGLDRRRVLRAGRAGARAGREGPRLHRRRQGDAARRRARDPARASCPSTGTRLERGQVELSTSPFYHPILPLLCDTDVYLRTHPHSRMPRERFRHPEDALEQLRGRWRCTSGCSGARPTGCGRRKGRSRTRWCRWSPRPGFRWMATDEEILARTLGHGLHARRRTGNVEQPERSVSRRTASGAPDATVACGFRDHTLSDLIGFTYASWSAGRGRRRLRRVAWSRRAVGSARATGGGEATIFVILDGENAWEHYEGQGRPFLRALYGRLGSHPGPADRHDERGVRRRRRDAAVDLSRVVDQRRLLHLDRPRRRPPGLEPAGRCAPRARRAAAGLAADALARAREEMLIAEGSDWFWWYGDDHSSDHDLRVRRPVPAARPERLPRARASRFPRSCSSPTSRRSRPTSRSSGRPGSSQPVIDGEVTSYFEWVGAGCVEATSVGRGHAPGRRAASRHRARRVRLRPASTCYSESTAPADARAAGRQGLELTRQRS